MHTPQPQADPSAAEYDQLDALLHTGRFGDVEVYTRSLLQRYLQSAYLWGILGFAQLHQGKTAIAALEKAVGLAPQDASAHNNLGNALQHAGQLQAAANAFHTAVRLRPDYFEAHNNLGNALRDMGQVREALACYQKALALQRAFAQAHNNLGMALRHLGALNDAVQSIRRALKLMPSHAGAHNNLGLVLSDLGLYTESLASFRKALELKPQDFDAFSNLLFVQNLLSEASPAEMLHCAQRYGALVSASAVPVPHNIRNLDTGRCLRVGLVSGDLRSHAAGYFLESVLQGLSTECPGKIQIFAYSTYSEADALTARIRRHCAGWYVAVGVSDAQLAQKIVLDEIDILIDLSGHTAHNRLPVFAYRAAPIQVTWLGYFATTGMAAIDYVLADPWTLPETEEPHFTEKVLRLPETRLCFTAPDLDIAVSPLPAQHNGYLTFGCFNNLSKMNDAVVSLWSQILAAVPSSRLFLKAKQLREEGVRQSVIARFMAHGVAADRLVLEGSVPRAEYLAAYHRVDIALDPFPYPGGATTAEALWMGVPVLTLAGQRFLSRQGVGLLMNAGLTEWVAHDHSDYVARALAFSKDLEGLAALRHALRPQVLLSPIFDGPRFARQFETALRAMWESLQMR